jgi:hypothetical protein
MKKGEGQAERLYKLLQDKKAHRTDEILQEIYGASHLGIARISARIYDVKQRYNVAIACKKDKHNPTLVWYELL